MDGQRAQQLTISVAEAAARLGIGRNAAYEAVKRGEIPMIRIGKRLLVPLAAFDRLLRGEAGPHVERGATRKLEASYSE